MRNSGFTLLELTVSTAVLAIVGLLAYLAATTSAQSAASADALMVSQDNVRSVMLAVSREVQLAYKDDDLSILPEVRGLETPAPGEVLFQVPRPDANPAVSTPIRYRWVDEDLNTNSLLDDEEDVDGDGRLTRCLVRLEDLDGDGLFASPGERRIIGSANNISGVQFARNGDTLTITLAARRHGHAEIGRLPDELIPQPPPRGARALIA